MIETRKIRGVEKELIFYLITQSGLNPEDYPVAEEVSEYEGGIMGSINFAGSDPDQYDSDLIQAEYTDSDGVEVLISLTKDKNNQLLDLDFWKADFSKLIRYPTPALLTLLRK